MAFLLDRKVERELKSEKQFRRLKRKYIAGQKTRQNGHGGNETSPCCKESKDDQMRLKNTCLPEEKVIQSGPENII